MLGTRKARLGMVRRLLTDARETSYVICSSLFTAEYSTVELPGISCNAFVFIVLQETDSCHDLSA